MAEALQSLKGAYQEKRGVGRLLLQEQRQRQRQEQDKEDGLLGEKEEDTRLKEELKNDYREVLFIIDNVIVTVTATKI